MPLLGHRVHRSQPLVFVAATMDSIIEVQRQTHEEIERFERALAIVLSKPQTTQQVKLSNEHKSSQILDRIHSRVTALHNHYQDEVSRKAEMDALSSAGKPDDLGEFYARLGKIKDYHYKYPDVAVGSVDDEVAAFLADVPEESELDGLGEEDREWPNYWAADNKNSCLPHSDLTALLW